MATKSTNSTIVKQKTSAPKISRARKTDTVTTTGLVTREQIAQRAYERFAARGFQHGHDVEDWLGAEAELTAAS